MPEQSEALENNNEKAVAKVKIDLKATKAKAPENKKSVDFVVPYQLSSFFSFEAKFWFDKDFTYT